MPDPLAVEQAELRSIIRQLEELYQNLPDANAQVSIDGLGKLQALREQLDDAQARHSRSEAKKLTKGVLAKIAMEVLWKAIETSIRFHFAVRQRIRRYIDAARWGGDPLLTSSRRAFAG